MAHTNVKEYYFCIGGLVMRANLILIDLQRLNVIFEINFLVENYASIDFLHKEVTFRILGLLQVMFYGNQRVYQASLILAFVAYRLLRKCCIGYLAHIVNNMVEEVRIEYILVARDFLFVFSNDLPRLHPKREIDFAIDLNLNTNLITFPLYRMTPVKLKELKV